MGNVEPQRKEVDFSKLNFARSAHSYLQETRQGDYTLDDLNVLNNYVNYLFRDNPQPEYKIGLMFVCINPPYWQYAEPVMQGVRSFFLPGHDTEIMCWSDVPKPNTPEAEALIASTAEENKDYVRQHIDVLGDPKEITVFPTESVEWPYPTLMRYHLFLQQEEYLKKFDYLFYLDLDMRIVNVVGDEILGDGLTASQHPMYALDRKFFPPYEPNPNSASYISRPGRILEENGKSRFEPLYYAGGFQGGKTEDFIKAMKGTKTIIDRDLNKNYIPIWNDESAWNKYLADNPPAVVLNPSYVYPDSMIEEYYKKIWGRDYPPKIITLTKPFTTSSEGGAAAAKMINQLS